jgi:T-complex protein 1 subunit theta
MPPAGKKASINADNVRVAKLIGGSIFDSQVVKGVVVQREAEGTIKRVEKAKIAVFGCSIEASATETRGTVVIKTADDLMSYNKSEEAMMEESIKGIAAAGVKVVVAGGSISEIALHYIEKYSMMAIKVLSKFELRRLCKAVNAVAMVRVGPPMAEELGYADVVCVQELSSRLVTVFRQDSNEDSSVATIVLRGATMNALDDIERAIDDAVNVSKQICKDGRLLPGAGAIEIELAHRIAQFGAATPGLEQYAINKFAEALEVVPRILAENSGQNATDVVSALYAAHADGKKNVGVNIYAENSTSTTLDAAANGIFDSTAVKVSAFRLASEAAMTVLRVDQIIMSKQAGGPKPRAPGPQDADE